MLRSSGNQSFTKGGRDRQAWLAKLADLRQRLATGKSGLTVEGMRNEDQGD